jgi:hypothetical protein
MIDNYAEKNVEETLAAARRLDGADLVAFVAYERKHKNRTTVIDPLERQLVDVTPTDRQYAGGLWFDDLNEVRTVARTTRVERAIETGALEVVD